MFGMSVGRRITSACLLAEEISHFAQTRKVTETPRVNLPKSGVKDMATDDMLIIVQCYYL